MDPRWPTVMLVLLVLALFPSASVIVAADAGSGTDAGSDQGSALEIGSGTIDGRFNATDTIDVYTTNLSSPSYVQVVVTQLEHPLTLEVLDDQFSVVDSGDNFSQIDVYFNSTGPIYLRVTAQTTPGGNVSYSVDLDVQAHDDAGLGTDTDLAGGCQVTSGDHDAYLGLVSADSADEFCFMMTGKLWYQIEILVNGNNNIDLELRVNGTLVKQSQLSGANLDSLSHYVDEDRIGTLNISLVDSVAWVTYSFRISAVPQNDIDRLIDAPSNATMGPVFSPTPNVLCLDGLLVDEDNQDGFRFDIIGGDMAAIAVNQISGAGLRVRLLDNLTLIDSEEVGSQESANFFFGSGTDSEILHLEIERNGTVETAYQICRTRSRQNDLGPDGDAGIGQFSRVIPFSNITGTGLLGWADQYDSYVLTTAVTTNISILLNSDESRVRVSLREANTSEDLAVNSTLNDGPKRIAAQVEAGEYWVIISTVERIEMLSMVAYEIEVSYTTPPATDSPTDENGDKEAVLSFGGFVAVMVGVMLVALFLLGWVYLSARSSLIQKEAAEDVDDNQLFDLMSPRAVGDSELAREVATVLSAGSKLEEGGAQRTTITDRLRVGHVSALVRGHCLIQAKLQTLQDPVEEVVVRLSYRSSELDLVSVDPGGIGDDTYFVGTLDNEVAVTWDFVPRGPGDYAVEMELEYEGEKGKEIVVLKSAQWSVDTRDLSEEE